MNTTDRRMSTGLRLVDLFGTATAAPRAMGSHQSAAGGTDEWLTPPTLLERLGPFDLDPCAPISPPWRTAATQYDIRDDGLSRAWAGRVWLNPPYTHAGKWLHHLAGHGDGLALLFARTETALWFDHIWPHAAAILFLRGRLTFHHVDGRRAAANAGAPSALIAYGDHEADRLATCSVAGQFIDLREVAS